MCTLLEWQTNNINLKYFIVTNNYIVATLVCTTFLMDQHIYFFISLNYDYMFVIASTLSMFYHTRELKKIHHLIVVECACVGEFIGSIFNLAQIFANVMQMLACNLLPLMSFLQSQGKSIVDY